MQEISKDKFQIIGIENDGVESVSRPRVGYFQDDNGNYIYSIDDATKDDVNETLYKVVQEKIF